MKLGRQPISRALAVVLVATLLMAGWLFWGDAIKAGGAWVMEEVRAAGAAVFFVAMALLPLVGFPLAPFVFAAGPAFGPRMGAGMVALCAVSAVAVNVALGYWIAARLLRPPIVRWLARSGRGLPDGGGRYGWQIILALRVIPGTPFFIQTYLLGVGRVPFGVYMIISVVVPAAYIVGGVYAGDAMMRGDKSHLVYALAVIVLAAVAVYFVRRKLAPKRRAASSPEISAPGDAPVQEGPGRETQGMLE